MRGVFYFAYLELLKNALVGMLPDGNEKTPRQEFTNRK